MPGKSKAGDTAAQVSDEAIQKRAYYLWEADGRPEGRGDHYWHLASQEAHKAMVEDTATRTARITKGKNPSEMPDEVKASGKASKAKVKAAEAGKAAKPAKVAKPVEVKKAPKPRAAIQRTTH
jgi:hypothetical protein